MSQYIDSVEKDYEQWKNAKPNLIQQGAGLIGKPVEFFLNPVIKRVSPILEEVLKGYNNVISKTLLKFQGNFSDFNELSEEEFDKWLQAKDLESQNLVTAGVLALSAEGTGVGFLGITGLAIDIPASFGGILGFANQIALTYQMDITDEEVQLEILKAIAAGSATNITDKMASIATFKYALKIVNTVTWKTMAKAPKYSMEASLLAIRSFLKTLGINISKRKLTQVIPVVGAVAGGAVNGAWAADALQAVRQVARVTVARSYGTKES